MLVSGASAAGAAPNLCVATNGVVRHQAGTATCAADAGDVAIAKGDFSFAIAVDGTKNKAKAFGDGAEALAFVGNGNTATASTDGCFVTATGNDQTASC
jgi:hypothetical protein